LPRLWAAAARGADRLGETRLPQPRRADAPVGPDEPQRLPLRRQRLARPGVARRGSPELGDFGLEAALLGEQPVERRQVARLAGLDEHHQLAERGRRHEWPRARAALRMRSAKRIAAATAR